MYEQKKQKRDASVFGPFHSSRKRSGAPGVCHACAAAVPGPTDWRAPATTRPTQTDLRAPGQGVGPSTPPPSAVPAPAPPRPPAAAPAQPPAQRAAFAKKEKKEKKKKRDAARFLLYGVASSSAGVFLGRPRGRNVWARPNRAAVGFCQLEEPKKKKRAASSFLSRGLTRGGRRTIAGARRLEFGD